MDSGASDSGDGGDKKPRALPSDLPKSLDDRKAVRTSFVPETEMYDGWQGKSTVAGNLMTSLSWDVLARRAAYIVRHYKASRSS